MTNKKRKTMRIKGKRHGETDILRLIMRGGTEGVNPDKPLNRAERRRFLKKAKALLRSTDK